MAPQLALQAVDSVPSRPPDTTGIEGFDHGLAANVGYELGCSLGVLPSWLWAGMCHMLLLIGAKLNLLN